MQLKEKKSSMERDKRKLESELERQRQTIGKQVFLQVVSKRQPSSGDQLSTNSNEQQNINTNETTNMTSSPKPLRPPVTSSPNTSITSPLSVDSSQNFNLLSKEKETSRRQWDKSKKNFDLENETTTAAPAAQTQSQKTDIKVNSAGAASSSSSLSTPSSAASQSPSQIKDNKTSSNNNLALDAMSVDLSKAYYSRDEMIKAIEALKDRYVRESSVVAELSNNNVSSPSNLNNNNNNNGSSNNTSMVKDIETLNSKLSSLQNEINRLTLLQQKQYDQQHNQANSLLSKASNTPNSKNNNSANNSFNLNDERKVTTSDKEDIQSVKSNTNNSINKNDDALNNDAFFVSFGNGLAKREKPLALTPKKNLIFIKSKPKINFLF